MLINTITLLYGLLVFAIILLFLLIRRMAKIRFWIKVSQKPGSPMTKIGYLEMSDDDGAGEVRLPGGGGLPPVGRVIAKEQSKVNHGLVELLASDIEDESAKPRYMQCGYICFDDTTEVDEFGYIYKQIKGKKKKELVGYCAKPSAPNVPTLVGERSWKTLWLVKTLHAYSGKPTVPTQEAQKDQKKDVNYLVGIHADATKDVDIPSELEQTDLAATEGVELPVPDTTEQAVTEEVAPSEPEVTSPAPVEEGAPSVPEATEQAATEQEEQSKEAEAKEKEPKETKKRGRKKKAKKDTKQPIAVVKSYGFHFNSNSYLPAEARACAYALLARFGKKRKFAEFYKEQAYGWADVALLTSAIYTLLYLLLYTINTGVLQLPLLGEDLIAMLLLIVFYPLLWIIVRLIKISSIENSCSIQNKLDIMNKNLRLTGQNITIIILGIVAFYFTLEYYDYDFIPLIVAILIGVFVNMMSRSAKTPWTIYSSFNEDEQDMDEEAEVLNPPGDISRTYEWSLDATYSSQELKGSLTLYFSANEMHDVRQCNPFFFQRKDKTDKEYIMEMFDMQVSHKSAFLARVKYIASYINRVIAENNLTPLDKIQFTLDFIQEPNILYVKNGECKEVNYYEDYIRFPEETLYDKIGDCNSKSLLAAMLFHTMGYNVLYLASRKFQHAAIGIEINPSDLANGWYGSEKKIKEMVIVENNRSYIYCETTGDRFSVGHTIEGMTLADFEEKLLLPVSKLENDDEEDNVVESRIYNWDLHPTNGVSKLHGNLTLSFKKTAIDELRDVNPFRTYLKDRNTYENNVESMFSYLFEDADRCENVRIIADYIRKQTAASALTEIEMVQFVLDFVQVPNITYCVDGDSAGISFAKEYMRFPDEVLYDKEGDCDCKSSLAVAIFHELGYNMLLIISQKQGHAAVAIECKEEWLKQINIPDLTRVVREYKGRLYLFCETTGDGNRVGDIKEGSSILDFETLVEIRV